MRYCLYRQQEGQGCDYMISCAEQLVTLRAQTKEDAIKEVIGLEDGELDQIVKDHESDPNHLDDVLHDLPWECGYLGDGDFSPRNERKMASVMLYGVSEEIDMLPLLKAKFNEVQDIRAAIKAKAEEDAERQAYERMKVKFEKPKKESVSVSQ